jgi:hypothetical protein
VTVREGEENENKSEIHEFKNDGNGVKQEVAVWAQGIVDGKPDPRFSPEEALVDLVCHYSFFASIEPNIRESKIMIC